MTAVSQANPAHELTDGHWLAYGMGRVMGFSPRGWPDAWSVSEDVSPEETWSRSGKRVMAVPRELSETCTAVLGGHWSWLASPLLGSEQPALLSRHAQLCKCIPTCLPSLVWSYAEDLLLSTIRRSVYLLLI